MTDQKTEQREGGKGKQTHSRKEVFFRRLISTVCLWGVVGAAFWLSSNWIFFILLNAITLGGIREYFNLFPDEGIKRYRWHCYLLSLLYTGGLFFFRMGPANSGADSTMDGVIVSVLIISIIVARFHRPIEGMRTLEEIATTVFGFLYIVILFGFVTKIYQLPLELEEGKSTFYLLYLFAVTKFTDMGAYTVGSLFGRHKMVPHISPGKTWQGFGGAILGAVIASFACMALLGDKISLLTNIHALVLGVVLALAAVAGDLAESIIKRSLGAKDSGSIFPGIGGILDLIDSILFTAPILFFYLLALKS